MLRSKWFFSVYLCAIHVFSVDEDSDCVLEYSCSSHGGALESHTEKNGTRGIFSDRDMTNALTHTHKHTLRERGRKRENESEQDQSLSCRRLLSCSLRLCKQCVPHSAQPLWEGLRHCAAPSCIVSMCDCAGCRELSQGLSCQCIAPCVLVPMHSPFLLFTAGSFLRPNSLLSPPPSITRVIHVWIQPTQ